MGYRRGPTPDPGVSVLLERTFACLASTSLRITFEVFRFKVLIRML